MYFIIILYVAYKSQDKKLVETEEKQVKQNGPFCSSYTLLLSW